MRKNINYDFLTCNLSLVGLLLSEKKSDCAFT